MVKGGGNIKQIIFGWGRYKGKQMHTSIAGEGCAKYCTTDTPVFYVLSNDGLGLDNAEVSSLVALTLLNSLPRFWTPPFVSAVRVNAGVAGVGWVGRWQHFLF